MEYQVLSDRIARTEDKRYFPTLKVATLIGLPLAFGLPAWSITHWHEAISGLLIPLALIYLFVYCVAVCAKDVDLRWKEPYKVTKVNLNSHLYNVIQAKHMWNPTYANAVETLFNVINEDKRADAREWRATFEAMNEELGPITKERQRRELINPDTEAYLYEIREFKKLMDRTSNTL